MSSAPLFAVIMAGGSGTRFWPLSRAALPKQFLSLTSKNSLLEETAKRISTLVPLSNVRVVCGERHARLVRKTLPKLKAQNVVVEPSARNTAPAIALSLAQLPDDATVVVLPSDQHVVDAAQFVSALREAVALAQAGDIVTLGIRPTRAETGFGYIELGAKKAGAGHRVRRFVEKPNPKTAAKYLSSGRYLWNAGIFVFQVKVMREAFLRHAPDIGKPLQKLMQLKSRGPLSAASVRAAFETMPSISIDYAVAEKASNMTVVGCECGWSDVGSFPALAEVRAVDGHDNVLIGAQTVAIDVERSVVWSESRVVALVGVKDLVVVDTPDALLVVHRDACQDVKKVVEVLKSQKRFKVL